MKKELLNELENYFYSERYEEMPQYRTEYIDSQVIKWLEERGIAKKNTFAPISKKRFVKVSLPQNARAFYGDVSTA